MLQNAWSNPTFGWRWVLRYTDPRKKKRFWKAVPDCFLLRNNFQNGVLVCFISKIPLVKAAFTYYWEDLSCVAL
jgi:hypothetical protein